MASRNPDRFGPTPPKPRNDAYVGLLGLSLIAMIIGCTFLYLDYAAYGEMKPPAVPKAVAPADGAVPPGQPAPGMQPMPGGAMPMPGGAMPADGNMANPPG